MRLKRTTASPKSRLTNALKGLRVTDFLMALFVFLAAALVITTIVTYIMAAGTKLSSYTTPIPLTQSSYIKGEVIKGYFVGSKLYNGTVQITRQIACSDGYADTLPNIRDGSDVVESILPARQINGSVARDIALVPDGVTVGASCVITFNHSACVPYLFGCYEQTYQYTSFPFVVGSGEPPVSTSTNSTSTSSTGSNDYRTYQYTAPSDDQSETVVNNTTNNTTPTTNQGVTGIPVVDRLLKTIGL